MDATFIEAILNLNGWMTNVQEATEPYREALFKFSLTLAYLAVVWLGFKAIMGGMAAFKRGAVSLGMAAFLLALSPAINDASVATWESVQQVSSRGMVLTMRDAQTEFQRVGNATVDMMVTSSAMMNSSYLVKLGLVDSALGNKLYQRVRDQFTRWVNLALPAMVVVVIFMFIALVLTGMVVSFAGVLLPISAVRFAFGGPSAGTWFANYIRLVTSSLLFVLLFPLGCQFIFAVTATVPARILADNIEAQKAELDELVVNIDGETGTLSAVSGLDAQIAEIDKQIADLERTEGSYEPEPATLPYRRRPLTAEKWGELEGYLTQRTDLEDQKDAAKETYRQNVDTQATNTFQRFGRNMNAWLLSILVMLLAVIGGTVGLLKQEHYIAELVNGLVFGAGAAVSTLAQAAASMLGMPAVRLAGGAGGAAKTAFAPRPPALPSGNRPALGKGGGGLARQSTGMSYRHSSAWGTATVRPYYRALNVPSSAPKRLPPPPPAMRALPPAK